MSQVTILNRHQFFRLHQYLLNTLILHNLYSIIFELSQLSWLFFQPLPPSMQLLNNFLEAFCNAKSLAQCQRLEACSVLFKNAISCKVQSLGFLVWFISSVCSNYLLHLLMAELWMVIDFITLLSGRVQTAAILYLY